MEVVQDEVVKREEYIDNVDDEKKIKEIDAVNDMEEFEENEELICDWLKESV